MKRNSLSERVVTVLWVMSLNQRRADMRKKFSTQEGGRVLAQAARRSWKRSPRGCGCHLPGNIQGQAGWDFEQPDMVGGVPSYSREVRTR